MWVWPRMQPNWIWLKLHLFQVGYLQKPFLWIHKNLRRMSWIIQVNGLLMTHYLWLTYSVMQDLEWETVRLVVLALEVSRLPILFDPSFIDFHYKKETTTEFIKFILYCIIQYKPYRPVRRPSSVITPGREKHFYSILNHFFFLAMKNIPYSNWLRLKWCPLNF